MLGWSVLWAGLLNGLGIWAGFCTLLCVGLDSDVDWFGLWAGIGSELVFGMCCALGGFLFWAGLVWARGLVGIWSVLCCSWAG
jgi:hypothetical protein